MKIKISIYNKILVLIGLIFITTLIFFILRGIVDLIVIGFFISFGAIVTYVIFCIDKEIKKSNEYKKPDKELTKLGWLLLSLVIILSFVFPIFIGLYNIELNVINLLMIMAALCIPGILMHKFGIRSTK